MIQTLLNNPFLLIGLEIFSWGLFAIPFLVFFHRGSPEDRRGLFFVAPLFGAMLSAVLINFAEGFGLSPKLTLLFPFLLFLLAALLKKKFHSIGGGLRSCLQTCLVDCSLMGTVIGLVLLINALDYWSVGVTEYFPRTNGDTLSYLGGIENFKIFGRWWPADSYFQYPSDLSIHGMYDRPGVCAFVGLWADFFRLEPHIAFFSIIRSFFPMVVLALFSVLQAAGVRRWVAILGASLFVFGNFYLHQILQQFLSSVAGLGFSVAMLFFLLRALGPIGSAWAFFPAGLSLGAVFLVSSEAGPFFAVSMFLFFLFLLSTETVRASLHRISMFTIGFVVAIFPQWERVWALLHARWYTIGTPHPGMAWPSNDSLFKRQAYDHFLIFHRPLP